jgi:hypothetical protein
MVEEHLLGQHLHLLTSKARINLQRHSFYVETISTPRLATREEGEHAMRTTRATRER